MESPYFTRRKATACGCASTRTSEHRLKVKVGGLNHRRSSHPIILKAELDADGFLTPSLSAQATQLGKP